MLKPWNHKHKPLWKTYLDNMPDYIIEEEIGLSKEQLEKVLDVLYEHRVIN